MGSSKKAFVMFSILCCHPALFLLPVKWATLCFLLSIPILTLPVPGDTYITILFDREEIGNTDTETFHKGKTLFQQSLTA